MAERFALYEEILHPTAGRFGETLRRGVAVAGRIKGAAGDVRIATQGGLPVYRRIEDYSRLGGVESVSAKNYSPLTRKPFS